MFLSLPQLLPEKRFWCYFQADMQLRWPKNISVKTSLRPYHVNFLIHSGSCALLNNFSKSLFLVRHWCWKILKCSPSPKRDCLKKKRGGENQSVEQFPMCLPQANPSTDKQKVFLCFSNCQFWNVEADISARLSCTHPERKKPHKTFLNSLASLTGEMTVE